MRRHHGGSEGLFVGTLILLLLCGCGTFNSTNIAGRPWDRPTREELVPDPVLVTPLTPIPDEHRPGDHYP